jgi:antitoxin component YwqK of YwqJK toxin-antitoxin module
MKNSKYPGKTAIEEYFIERPNIARIFDELNFSLIKGDTVEKYLNQANLMRDSDTRRIVSQGFSDISVFLEELESDVNILIRKDKAISEEFKNKHGEEMPEGLIGTFILYPEIKEALREAKELLNKDDGTGSQVEQLYRRLFSISESWNSILTTRASWRTMSIENLNFSYWDMAISHTEEYLLKYEEDRMDVEGITYRIDTLNLFISEYEKYFESCLKSNTEISKDVNNKFFAVVESLIGAELTLVKMVEAGENYDTNLLYNRKDRPNSETINDAKISAKNTDFEDIMEYTFHKGCIYNGWWNEVNENNVLLIETPFRFGLKHGIEKRFHENGTLKMEILYFNDKSVEILSEFDEDGKILTSTDKISEIEEEKNPNIDNSKEEGSKVSESFKNNLNNPITAKKSPPKQPEKKPRKYKIYIFLILLLLIFGACYLFFLPPL